ncbi:hypothetical protein JKF63_04526 [Porcisia hertigi]|uniref:Uncharacterized protein n=1 Tax=Porcisia hertigi TaxID=2761500 RepID=A0A836L8S2_9TRYP|nr:hypothetical protein JKF63_04526 [Porcisia hertigi]
MCEAGPTHTAGAAAVTADVTATTEETSPKTSSGKAVPSWSLTPAERRGVIVVVAVALFQEVHSSVFRGVLIGAMSAAIVYNQFNRPHRSP